MLGKGLMCFRLCMGCCIVLHVSMALLLSLFGGYVCFQEMHIGDKLCDG